MRTRILKTLSVCAVLLFCAASFAFAAVECNFDPTDYGWDINNPEVWANKVATIEITCTENGLPVSDHTAEFTLTLNKGPIDNYSPIQILSVFSTPTDSSGKAYINVPLIHVQATSGEYAGQYIHLCPFDDVNCAIQETPANNSLAASKTSSEIIPATSNIVYDPGCFGLLGCCQTTITINCCNPPIVLPYCTTTIGLLCPNIEIPLDPCTKKKTEWHENGVCNYCAQMCEDQTAITLSSFTASPGNGSVTLSWTTETEIDNAGFNILRADSENGDYVKINASIIPAKAGATQGASYQFTDGTAKNRKTYYYKLEDIDLNGIKTMHGPKSVTPRLILGILGK